VSFEELLVKNYVSLTKATEECPGVLAEMQAQLDRAQDNFMITRETLAAWYEALNTAHDGASGMIEATLVVADTADKMLKAGHQYIESRMNP
jgi:hypothetical protein